MESRRFDQLTVTLAAGSTRRRALAGLGAVAMGTLLGRNAEAKPSGNKGKSGTNGNADCNAACAHEAKDARKVCQDKKNKSTKKECLKRVKNEQAGCRLLCGPADNTGTGTETGSVPATDTGTNAELSILAKPICVAGQETADCPMCAEARKHCCVPGGGEQDCGKEVDLDCTEANATYCSGTCATATCTTRESTKMRCDYTRAEGSCKGAGVCCARFTSPKFGQCVKTIDQCQERASPLVVKQGSPAELSPGLPFIVRP